MVHSGPWTGTWSSKLYDLTSSPISIGGRVAVCVTLPIKFACCNGHSEQHYNTGDADMGRFLYSISKRTMLGESLIVLVLWV